MKKKAVITVKSAVDTGDEDNIEVVSIGTFEKQGNKFVIEYDETEISGMEGTKTTLTIDEDTFSLNREGTTETKMEFRNNKENVVFYKTPYGIMNMKTFTKKLEMDMNENGGHINVTYVLVLEEEQKVNTNLTINILVNDNQVK